MYENPNDEPILVAVRNYLEEAERKLHLRDFEGAFASVERALKTARDQENTPSLAAAYYGKAAVIWGSGGSSEEAHRYASLAAQHSRPDSETDLMIRTLIARIKADRQNFDAAIVINEDLLNYYKRENRLDGQANVLRSLGDIHRAKGEYERARERYLLGLAIFSFLDDPLNHAGLLLSLGSLMYETQDFEQAKRYWLEARSIAEGSGFRDIVDKVDTAIKELL